VQWDSGFLYGKAVVFCTEIKARPCRRYEREHLMQFTNLVTGSTFKELGFNSRQEKVNFFSKSGLTKFDPWKAT
jgi:hypothetical protein